MVHVHVVHVHMVRAYAARLVYLTHICQMRRLIQDVKVKGLPGGEAHRIDSYISMIGVGFDRLCAIKEYRTPRAFRAFARVNILLVRAAPACIAP